MPVAGATFMAAAIARGRARRYHYFTTIRIMPSENVYLNGRIVPADQATVSVSDAGLLHGASAFTTMLGHNGVVFRIERHLARLRETVDLLSLRVDPGLATAESLTEATYELLRANELSESRIRITLTPGDVRRDAPTTLITADPLGELPKEWYEKGISVVVSSFKQAEGEVTYGRKTGCYLPRVLARREAAAKGAEEALWFTAANRLAEGCFSNVFLVLGGEVFTPPLDTPVLGGVVREAVLELCPSLGIAHHDDRELTVREMLDAEEIFLTGSCVGIRPVVRIERHGVGDEAPGEITRRIMRSYRELLDRECKAP